MRDTNSASPDFLPRLSAGRHRSPRRGGCFMEFASFLAGEQWSDHPSCTHPALASLARAVNDCTTDAERSRLAPLIPSVIGLTGTHPHASLLVGVLAGCAALPIASQDRQRAIATALVRADEVFAVTPEDFARSARARIRDVFIDTPAAERWAREFLDEVGPARGAFGRGAIERLIGISVTGIATACVSDDRDERLRLLLETAIRECSDLFSRSAGTSAHEAEPSASLVAV